MMQMTDSTKRTTRMRNITAIRVKSTLASSFSLLRPLKAQSSRPSLTNALITAMPEKLSWEKSAWRVSHFSVMYLPTRLLHASISAMGMRLSSVMRGFMPNIFTMESPPIKTASKSMMKPEP